MRFNKNLIWQKGGHREGWNALTKPPILDNFDFAGQVAELVDALALGASGSNPVEVRVLSCPPGYRSTFVITQKFIVYIRTEGSFP